MQHTINFKQFGKTKPFGKNLRFCQIISSNPQSPHYQRHQKRKKERPTNHSGEPLYAQNPLILSHFSILLPASTHVEYHQQLFNWCQLIVAVTKICVALGFMERIFLMNPARSSWDSFHSFWDDVFPVLWLYV